MQQFGLVLTLLAVMPMAFAQSTKTNDIDHARLAPKILTRVPMGASAKPIARDLADALDQLSPEQRALLVDRIDAMTRLRPAGASATRPLYLPFDRRHPLDFDQDRSPGGATDID